MKDTKHTRGPYNKDNKVDKRIGLRLPSGLYDKLIELKKWQGDQNLSITIRKILEDNV